MLVGLTAWLISAPASAQADGAPAPIRAVIVSLAQCCPESSFVAAEARLLRELEILGAEVIVVPGTASREHAQRREFARMIRGSNADVVVRLIRARHLPGVQLWVSEAGSMDVTTRYLYLGDLDGDAAAQITGLKAVEAVAGCRQDLPLGSHAVNDPVRPAADTDQTGDGVDQPSDPEANRRARFRVALGPVICGSRGGLGPRGGLRLGFTFAVAPALSFRATGQLALLGPDLVTDTARSSFDFGLVRGWWVWHFADRGPIRAATTIGGGVAVFVSEGASEIHETQRDSTSAGVVGAGVELSIVPVEQLRFRFSVGVALLGPEVTVQFDGDPVATMGRPLMEGAAAIVVGFP